MGLVRRGESVLVTGGCGSVGSAVVDYLLQSPISCEVSVFDNDERRVFEQRASFDRAGSSVEFELGDVRDIERLDTAVRNADHIVHAAALKQVPQCERQPYESVKTNVEGTKNVIKLAKRHGVESVLTVSTDKATNPSSVMGASKMLAERVTLTADRRSGPDGPSFGSVRLGNVLGSSGSVVPVFLEQIENGGPVTLTDERMTRFVITKTDAAAFIVDHIGDSPSGVTYIPELDTIRIEDLAEVMTEIYADHAPESGRVNVEKTGRRPGERLHEILVSQDEAHRTVRSNGEYVVHPPASDAGPEVADETREQLMDGLSSNKPTPLGHEEIRQLLQETENIESANTSTTTRLSAVPQHD
ncbi:polysaccharide biosynthesis protein [Haloarcula salinisoli]|uniref:Polysaccharide biosynthesis protein n=1 Tax=Haloarcula salinisoli TaxID=2487746 RepID=A0A8J7YGB4_9EURY|nr:polysaccharide biosynthesis protein [Halomicroarcula salinisoli]MBX0288243.1 polysaccharide biosynthesis protein [Halomicroarcula salinisoli]MBX0305405.1 polysaccharide biosynthesis protein [Halomicroarcula salinisoli]